MKEKEILPDYDHIMELFKKMKKQYQNEIEAKQRRANSNNHIGNDLPS